MPLVEYTFLIKCLFKVLSKIELGVVVASHLVEQTPEDTQEGMFLFSVIIILVGKQVDVACSDDGILCPAGHLLYLVGRRCNVVSVIQWVNCINSVYNAAQRFVAILRVNTVAQILQEVRLTRSEVTIHPNTYMSVLFDPFTEVILLLCILDSCKKVVEIVDDVICKTYSSISVLIVLSLSSVIDTAGLTSRSILLLYISLSFILLYLLDGYYSSV